MMIGRKFGRAGYAPDKGCYEADEGYCDMTGVVCMYMITILNGYFQALIHTRGLRTNVTLTKRQAMMRYETNEVWHPKSSFPNQ
jgi:hypothetical protein